MNKYSLTDLGEGRFILHGRVDFSNAGDALFTGQSHFNDHANITIDLGQADCASTAGLALLLEWSTWSNANGKRLSYGNAPRGLIDLVELNGVKQLLQMSPI